MQFRDILIAIFVMFLWSTNLITLKYFCADISLEFFSFLRFAFCIPLLFFFKRPSTPFFKLLLVTMFWNVGNILMSCLSLMEGTGAGNFSVAYQTSMFFSVIFCFFILREVPKIHHLIGMLLAFAGIILLFSNSLSIEGGMLGLAYVIMAAMSLGVGMTLFKKFHLASDLSTIVWLAALASVPMGALLLVKSGTDIFVESFKLMNMSVFSGVLYASYIVTVISGCIWLWLLRRYPSALVAPFILMMPLFSCIMSYFIFQERFTGLQLTAFLVVLFGIAINQNIFKIRRKVEVV